MRDSIYRAKRFYDNNWIKGSLVKANGKCFVVDDDYFRLDGHHITCDSDIPVFINEDSICQFTGLYCKSGNDNQVYYTDYIFEKDLVEITSINGEKAYYLIWYSDDDCSFAAIPWNPEDNNRFYVGHPLNFDKEISWTDFVALIDDQFEKNKEVKVIGNTIDNPDILDV